MSKKYECIHGINYEFGQHTIQVYRERGKSKYTECSPNVHNVICQDCLLELCLKSGLVQPVADEILLTANPDE